MSEASLDGGRTSEKVIPTLCQAKCLKDDHDYDYDYDYDCDYDCDY